MTYHKVKIAKLSKAQILKLLKGKRIRIKGGSIHDIHLTEGQKKEFNKLTLQKENFFKQKLE